MKKYLVVATVLGVLGAGEALAQGGGLATPKCPQGATALSPETVAQDACQQAYDVYQFLAPQIGLALTGGNATAGQGGVLGGLGHFSIGVRGNVFEGKLPDVAKFQQSTSGAVSRELPVNDQIVGLPTADAAIGLFKGFPLAVTNIGGVDGLVSATYIPSVDRDNVKVTPDQNLKFGWGARVGLLSESIVVPGVSLTWLERDLPTTSINATSGDDEISVTGISVKTSAWRAVAGKSLGFLGLAVGAGKDTYDSRATGSVVVNEAGFNANGGPYDLSQKVSRSNMFADFSLNFPLIKLGAEIGRVSGGKIDTYNTFSGKRADDPLTYASVGIRIGN